MVLLFRRYVGLLVCAKDAAAASCPEHDPTSNMTGVAGLSAPPPAAVGSSAPPPAAPAAISRPRAAVMSMRGVGRLQGSSWWGGLTRLDREATPEGFQRVTLHGEQV